VSRELGIYAKMLAWLHTPAKDQAKSRIEHLESEEAILERLPNVEPFDYMVGLFSDVGMAINTGNGLTPLSWQELDCFTKNTGISFTSWEARTIREMSAKYASGVVRYTNQNVQAPFRSDKEKERVADTMKSALRGMVIKGKDGLSRNQNKG